MYPFYLGVDLHLKRTYVVLMDTEGEVIDERRLRNKEVADYLEEHVPRETYAVLEATCSPLISPLYANLEDLPPLLIQVGADEILLDDATRFAKKARNEGVNVTLEIWDEMFHVFQLIPFLPETKQALTRIATFVFENTAQNM